ncbi:hypothetical protein EMGBS4_09860 [Acidimicrobiaceae bacterium]|nr:hypothetical protein EMGBS4_09860 [Acidimicrobiaceae bacterium]
MSETQTVLAELEIWHSRPFTPTRRLSIGNLVLPTDHSPGLGGVLLGGVVSAHFGEIDEDLVPDIHRLIAQIERGERVVQPRLRHRLQIDRHGLTKSLHQLVGDQDKLQFKFDASGSALAQVLGAIYAIERLDDPSRKSLTTVVNRSMRWRGPLDASFISFLAGSSATSISALADPRAWALELLGFPEGTIKPSKRQVQERYRSVLRSVHPDHGGDISTAGKSIEDLGEARRVLLRS